MPADRCNATLIEGSLTLTCRRPAEPPILGKQWKGHTDGHEALTPDNHLIVWWDGGQGSTPHHPLSRKEAPDAR